MTDLAAIQSITLLVVVSTLLGAFLAYPVALLLSRGDSEKRATLTAWVVIAGMLVLLAYVNILFVLVWSRWYI